MKTKAASFPTPSPQLIYSYQVSPGIQKICYQTGNEKYPFLPEGRGRNHILIETGNQLIRSQAMELREATAPISCKGWEAYFLLGFSHSLCEYFQARSSCYGVLHVH